MSSPIAIRRSSISSSGSASSASSSPARALYVPVHKRSASSSAASVSDVEEATSRQPESLIITTPLATHPRVYSTDFLLSLRPFAAVGVKEKMVVACPEAVMNSRVRKRVEHTLRSTPKSTTTTATSLTATRRITPRRARYSGRAPERRRQALNMSQDSWRGLGNESVPLL